MRKEEVAAKIVLLVIQGKTPRRSEVRRLQAFLTGKKWAEIENMFRKIAARLMAQPALMLGREAYAETLPAIPAAILSLIQNNPVKFFERLHKAHGRKEKVPELNRVLALAFDARLIPESKPEQEEVLRKGLTEGYLVLGYRLGGGASIETARKNQWEKRTRMLAAEIRNHFRLHGYAGEGPRYEELQAKLGRDADQERMVALWADGNLRVLQKGKGRALAFVIDPEILARLNLSEIISILQIIANAPPELKNFYLNSLNLTPKSDGLSYLNRDFVNALASLDQLTAAA